MDVLGHIRPFSPMRVIKVPFHSSDNINIGNAAVQHTIHTLSPILSSQQPPTPVIVYTQDLRNCRRDMCTRCHLLDTIIAHLIKNIVGQCLDRGSGNALQRPCLLETRTGRVLTWWVSDSQGRGRAVLLLDNRLLFSCNELILWRVGYDHLGEE
jgi:hypothetical protein